MWETTLLARYLVGEAFTIVCEHSRHVADRAHEIAVSLDMSADILRFIEEAALLHDVGVCQVYAPELGVYGEHPYIMHGVLGRAILEAEGYPRHALVCERHTGVGLTREDIIRQNLPLPHRDMTPQCLAEEIICFADLFFSKKPGKLDECKTVKHVRKNLRVFGDDKVSVFDSWLVKFNWLDHH
ncbi:MAG: HD domain-containing protein [Desulfuromonadaceae bacterium]|nr:HD domain-containing protein [Desulfuromonadaceae bacterium]MDD5105337.1 HD domain-containing protein [Desulfuromonadaceae bacterium]